MGDDPVVNKKRRRQVSDPDPVPQDRYADRPMRKFIDAGAVIALAVFVIGGLVDCAGEFRATDLQNIRRDIDNVQEDVKGVAEAAKLNAVYQREHNKIAGHAGALSDIQLLKQNVEHSNTLRENYIAEQRSFNQNVVEKLDKIGDDVNEIKENGGR